MNKAALLPLVAVVFLVMCSCRTKDPEINPLAFDKTKIRVVQTQAYGEAMGFTFLPIIQISIPTYADATEDLFRRAGYPDKTSKSGRPLILINRKYERSAGFALLFCLPRKYVTGDLAEVLGVADAEFNYQGDKVDAYQTDPAVHPVK
jgi:hypothetical protein